jgi:hypothetical protein
MKKVIFFFFLVSTFNAYADYIITNEGLGKTHIVVAGEKIIVLPKEGYLDAPMWSIPTSQFNSYVLDAWEHTTSFPSMYSFNYGSDVTKVEAYPVIVSPTSTGFGAGGGNQTIDVKCYGAWTVTTSDAWISLLPEASANNGSFTITATENTGAARDATVKVTKVTEDGNWGWSALSIITVSQEAYVTPAALSVSLTTTGFGAGGGNQTVDVTGNVAWTVTTPDGWISISPGAGTNNGSFTITAAENTGGGRNGTVTVTGGGMDRAITVSQEAYVAPAALSVSITTTGFGAGGGSQTVDVTGNVAWTVTTSDGWISISPGAGTNNGSFTITAAGNTGGGRNGTVTVTGGGMDRAITVSQEAYVAAAVLSVSITTTGFGAGGGNQTVDVTGNVAWTVTTPDGWISLSPAAGTNNGSFTITALGNTGGGRNGTVTVSGGGMDRAITVSQEAYVAAAALSVSITTTGFGAGGGSQTVDVTGSVAWEVTTSDTWISLSPKTGTNNGSFTITAAENTGIARSGTVTVSGGGEERTITVSQTASEAQPPLLSSDNSLSGLTVVGYALTPAFNPNTDRYTLTVPYATVSITVIAIANDGKASVNGDDVYSLAVGETTVGITVTAEDGTQRTYNIIVTRQDNPDTIGEVTAGLLVWGTEKALYIRSDKEGTARIYTISGLLAKKVSYHPGSTIIYLPSGIYIIQTDKKTLRVIVR